MKDITKTDTIDLQNIDEVSSDITYEYDSLTGLKSYSTFKALVQPIIDGDPQGISKGEYSLVYFDVMRFKVINDLFGTQAGDEFLVYMARLIKRLAGENSVASRINSDRFVLFVKMNKSEIEDLVKAFLADVAGYQLPYEIICNLGIYVTSRQMKVDFMVDRAILAFSVIKGDYVKRYNYYNKSQRDAMLGEQEITSMMKNALEERQFVVYYQPQYNHNDGSLVGAEALVRWQHPKRGIISPGVFIPIFEKNGFITSLDLYVFEEVCAFLRKCLDSKTPVVPISVNMSRRDIYRSDLVETMETIRIKYSVPVGLVRIEVTESALIDGVQRLSGVIDKLHDHGYIIEMDDFGSAYSSLNALKNIDLDILKLDLKFLSDDGDRKHGGIILSHVVRMAKWLGFSVIAEGVEQPEQADYLLSIGCSNIQGFLYAKPMPEKDYLELINNSNRGSTMPAMSLIDTMNADSFWNPNSLDTLIFNNYVGAAAIIEYKKNGYVEPLRINKKYVSEIGGRISEDEIIKQDFLTMLDQRNRAVFVGMLERAIASEQEEECETWRSYRDDLDSVCIRSYVRLIAKSVDSYLFYVLVRNVTSEKSAMAEIMHREKIFRAASEQVGVYYWEYDIKTKNMYPCFRCMRDLQLPPVVLNYPEPLFDAEIVPKDYADKYRAFMKKIDEGEDGMEMIIPLTADRVMFKMKYTVETDDNGAPIKAYGSAIPV